MGSEEALSIAGSHRRMIPKSFMTNKADSVRRALFMALEEKNESTEESFYAYATGDCVVQVSVIKQGCLVYARPVVPRDPYAVECAVEKENICRDHHGMQGQGLFRGIISRAQWVGCPSSTSSVVAIHVLRLSIPYPSSISIPQSQSNPAISCLGRDQNHRVTCVGSESVSCLTA